MKNDFWKNTEEILTSAPKGLIWLIFLIGLGISNAFGFILTLGSLGLFLNHKDD